MADKDEVELFTTTARDYVESVGRKLVEYTLIPISVADMTRPGTEAAFRKEARERGCRVATDVREGDANLASDVRLFYIRGTGLKEHSQES
jgi:hypothetical protein